MNTANLQGVLGKDLEDGALDIRSIPTDQHARHMSLEEAMPLLVSPEDKRPLRLSEDGLALVSPGQRFPIRNGQPVLLPADLLPYLGASKLDIPLEAARTPLLRHFLISSIKETQGVIAAATNTHWHRRHIFRSRQLLRSARGTVLDIGCGSARSSGTVFPAHTQYLGLDLAPGKHNEFQLVATAEMLPLSDASVDNVSFLASLDHILDYRTALEEAHRVLKPGGRLFISSLVWYEDAALFRDTRHFHHFREADLSAGLRQWSVEVYRKFIWKNDTHRESVYLAAIK